MVEIADQAGDPRVLLEELGAATMSLYRYISAKQELVDLMVDSVYGDPPPIESGASGCSSPTWIRPSST